ncbi:MAG TPA: neocarzinostatin apoprotein domain-containing protein [Candidatus Solibacter sp.]|nr:neocarzinostatin apoprotein domain-containing protein [Candidatus Solibacter sp.]
MGRRRLRLGSRSRARVLAGLMLLAAGGLSAAAQSQVAAGSTSASPAPSSSPTDTGASPGAVGSPAPSPSVADSPAPSPSPSPPPPPAIAASPNSQLVDGQYVKISLTGFIPGAAMNFRQCIAVPSNVSTDCTPLNPQITAYAASDGGGSTYVPVYTGDDPKLLTPAALAANQTSCVNNSCIPCDINHSCTIQARYQTRSGVATTLAPISFAATASFCPPIGPSSILGTGSADAVRAMYTWTTLVCGPPRNLGVQFAGYSSSRAYSDFFAAETDFGVSGIRPSTPTNAGFDYKLAPLTASAVVLAYRMYSGGTQITNLTLTPKIVADIYSGRVGSGFNADRDITSINPGVYFPQRMQYFARGDQSSENYELESWLTAAAPAEWISGAGSKGPQESFPLINGVSIGKTGESAEGLAVVDPTTDFSGQGNLGIMYASTAAFYGLPVAQIMLPSGAKVAATSDAILQAIAAAKANPDGTLTPQYVDPVHPGAYPMPTVTYMISPTNRISPDRGLVLQSFLRYAVQDGQGVLPTGYAPLPSNLVAQSLHVADQVPVTPPPGLPAPIGSATTPFAPFGAGAAPAGPDAAALAAAAAAAARARQQSEGVIASLGWNQGGGLRALIELELNRLLRLAIPMIAGVAALGLVLGIGLQALARWGPFTRSPV